MAFLDRFRPPRVRDPNRRGNFPTDLWLKCSGCATLHYRPELETNLMVCPHCHYHFQLSARKRIASLADGGSFLEHDADLQSGDPLGFRDRSGYPERLRAARETSGEQEAYLYGEATLGGRPVILGAFDFSFLGGSMGCVVGEKIARTFELAGALHRPAIIVTVSGGARMQEGVLSLMQMAKTCAALDRFREARGFFISVLAHPTTGGVAASFAVLGDVILAEPGALIGFAGPRVIAQTVGQELPEGFQRAEYLLAHGILDRIVPRHNLREELGLLAEYLG